MADLTFGAEVVHDGNDAAITGGIKTYTDPNDSSRKGPVVALILADGTVLRPGQALAAASLPVVLTAAQLTSLTAPVIAAGSNTIGATQDAGPSWTSVWGVSNVPVSSADMSGAAVDVTDAPTSGQKIVVDDIIVGADAAMRVDFTEETSGTVMLSVYLAAGATLQITPRGKRKLATANKKLKAQTSAAGNIRILVGYHSEA